MAKESEVLLQPGHKWNNIVFYNHTGLKTYPNYMMGGGYVVSGDVAQTIMSVNRKMQLKFTPIEDATMGFWLMAMVGTKCYVLRSELALFRSWKSLVYTKVCDLCTGLAAHRPPPFLHLGCAVLLQGPSTERGAAYRYSFPAAGRHGERFM